MEKFKAFAARTPNVYDTLVRSFAPSIWELDDVKRGVLCLLLGGSSVADPRAVAFAKSLGVGVGPSFARGQSRDSNRMDTADDDDDDDDDEDNDDNNNKIIAGDPSHNTTINHATAAR